MFKKIGGCVVSVAKQVSAGVAGMGVSAWTWAQSTAPDLAASAKTGVEAATAQGSTVGGYVVTGIATLCVIGVIIAIVRKL